MQLKFIKLKKNEDRRILAGHLWIYSNEIAAGETPLKNFLPGDLVEIISAKNIKIGIGYINPHNLLAVRLLARDPAVTINQDFFKNLLARALALRNRLFFQPYYRLVYGESDGLPGLVIDRYADILVIQINTAGMEQFRSFIIDACRELCKPQAILLKNDSSFRALEGLPQAIEIAYGEIPSEVIVEENGCQFYVSLMAGQKTGWFYDQRLNRLRLGHYVKDCEVLDLFSYVGSWGIMAAKQGARQVTCVDSSESACELITKNGHLNGVAEKIKVIHDDVFNALQSLALKKIKFDIIIADPPAFIKKLRDKKNGARAYVKLITMALNCLKSEGIIFFTSCSMHLSREELLAVCQEAANQCDIKLVVLEQLHQAPDHPIHPAIKETEYLKGVVLYRSPMKMREK